MGSLHINVKRRYTSRHPDPVGDGLVGVKGVEDALAGREVHVSFNSELLKDLSVHCKPCKGHMCKILSL